MKNCFIVMTSLLLSSGYAFAAARDTKSPLSLLGPTDTEKTPFEIVDAAFNAASPMAYLELPLITHTPSLRRTTCMDIKIEMTSDELVPHHWVPVRYRQRVVTEAARPAVPAHGPLFPGSPARPEISEVRAAVGFVDGRASFDQQIIDCANCLARKVTTETQPGVVLKALSNPDDEDSLLTMTFRSNDDVVLIKNEQLAFGSQAAETSFRYCWKNRALNN